VYIERPVNIADEKEDNYKAERSYELTVNCLNSFKDILQPFWNLWPQYTDVNHLSDYHSTVWVNANQLAQITSKIDREMSGIGVDQTKWGETTQSIISKLYRLMCSHFPEVTEL